MKKFFDKKFFDKKFFDKKFLIASFVIVVVFSLLLAPFYRQIGDVVMLGFPIGFFKIQIVYGNELAMHFNIAAFLSNIVLVYFILRMSVLVKNKVRIFG